MDRVTNPFYHYQNLWESEKYRKWQREQSDDYKDYRRKWVDCAQKHIPAEFPLSVNVEITDVCNAKEHCIMCPKHFLDSKNRYMPFATVKKILKEAHEGGAYAVNLNGAGESMLHPNVIEIVAYAKELGFFDIMFHTNGDLLNEERSYGLIEAGITRVIVSMDGHTPEIYQKIRPGFDFNKIYRNIRRFVEIRDSFGKSEPVVRLTMVVMKQNVHTIAEAMKFWDFVDYISINDCMYFDEYKAFDFNREQISKDAKEKNLSYVCAPLYQQLSVNVDLTVVACSTTYAKNYRVIGDYSKQSLMEIWNGNDLKEMRSAHENGEYDLILPCSKCDLPQIELLKRMRGGEGRVLTC